MKKVKACFWVLITVFWLLPGNAVFAKPNGVYKAAAAQKTGNHGIAAKSSHSCAAAGATVPKNGPAIDGTGFPGAQKNENSPRIDGTEIYRRR